MAVIDNVDDGMFQKTVIFNKYLPYADSLDREADELFANIKKNLSVAIQKRELWPGTLFWSTRLSNYLRVYGLRFSKEDHIALVKLFFELVTIDNLESPLLHAWCHILSRLLKKRRLLSPDDIQLPWRPIYYLARRVFHSKFKQLGMKVYSNHTSNAVHELLSHVRSYFPLESTQEMLDEWRPLFCPFDMSMMEGVNLLGEFLPTTMREGEHAQGIHLWFHEFVHLWLGNRSKVHWDEFWVKLFVRLAKENIGYIDWDPYMPQIFSRILANFQLPMGPKELQVIRSKRDFFNGDKPASLIVSMLGGGSQAQSHLSKLMQAVESYNHPSNLGQHTRKLIPFLKNLSVQFVARLKRERYSKPFWGAPIPQGTRLTEEDIDAFVKCVLPSLRMAVFSRIGIFEVALTMRNLSVLRPELVIPDLLERTYTALETLTEPHQVVSTISCVTAVSRSLLAGGRYPAGRSHLFSILTLALPGIDPNDFKKTLASSLLVSALVMLVPLVDCSTAVGSVEMSEQETELCTLSAQFEEFVVHFLDRCFLLVESSGLEQVTTLDRILSQIKTDNQENLMGAGVAGSIHSVLSQCSPAIFEVALNKIFCFATSRVFESQVAGKICAEVCGAAARVDPASTLKKFLPFCITTIERLLEDPDQLESENPDIELLWTLQLLSNVTCTTGSVLESYADDLIPCLKKCVHLKSKQASKHVAKVLFSFLSSLSQINPLESRNIPSHFGLSPKDHLYIRDWAAPANMDKLDVKWHVPSTSELLLVDKFLEEFLEPAMNGLTDMMEGRKQVDRETLLRTLELICHIFLGVSSYLGAWTGSQVEGCPESVVPMKRGFFATAACDVKAPPEKFSRKTLTEFFHKLAGYMMRECEDDSKSTMALIDILRVLLTNFGSERAEFETKMKAFQQSKRALDDPLHDKQRHVRPLVIARIHLQHELRTIERSMSPLTPLHLTLLQDLLQMAVGAYPEVRIKAQASLLVSFDSYIFSGRLLLPQVLPYLENREEVTHGQFKGALHVLMLLPMVGVVILDWHVMKKTLPAILKADHSEKPSILNLIVKLHNEIKTRYDTFAVTMEVPDSCLPVAATLHAPLSQEELDDGVDRLAKFNAHSLEGYNGTIETLVQIIQHGNLKWRFAHMAMQELTMLIRHDHPLPSSAVGLLVNNLVHDALVVRKIAIFALSLVLQQQKRVHKKVVIDVEAAAGVKMTAPMGTLKGEREEIKWLCLPDNWVESEESWDSNKSIIHKTHWGYYGYPKVLYGYAPVSEQPALNRPAEELPQGELEIHKAFTSAEFVEKLISFLSLEENKGTDRYNSKRVNMFKNLFRNFGSYLADGFREHLEKLAIDSQESSQRCACEIIAGLLIGSKHWSYQMMSEVRKWLEPLLRKVLDAITSETIDDWFQCVSDSSANRAPQHVHWMLKIFCDDPISGKNGAFTDASQLSLWQVCMAQQEWRVPSLLHQTLTYLTPHISHPFKNVREKIGNLLSSACSMDVSDAGFSTLYNPRREELVQLFTAQIPPPQELVSLPLNSDVLRVCKTAMSAVILSYHQSYTEYYELLGKLLPLVAYEGDDEVGTMLKIMCMQMCRCELALETLSSALDMIQKAISFGMWKVKVLVLQLLQVLVYSNLFLFSEATPKEKLMTMLMSLLSDQQIEVRELASSTISGLVQCGFIAHDCLQTKLPQKPKQARRRRRQGGVEETDSGVAAANASYEGSLVQRHSVVLGLTALVLAYPYTVPDWLPAVLDKLSCHLHDPAPISTSVKKTMSEFKRTHHDNWREHKLKFTEDQLLNLSDMLVSPSYYA